MSEYGIVTDAHTIRFERLLPGPIERVWEYLTDSEKRGRWLAKGEMELCEGGKVELLFRHSELSPEDAPEKYRGDPNAVHRMAGQVLRCEPPCLLQFTWGEKDGEVIFELSEQEDDLLLVLTHTSLRDRASMVEVAGGWHAHLGVLREELNETQPRHFWSTFERVVPEYETKIPKESHAQ